MKSGRALLVVALLAAIPGATLAALSIDELDANVGLIFIGSSAPSGYSRPDLAVAPLIGLSMPLQLSGSFFLEPGLEIMGTYYEWIPGADVAVLTPAESGKGFFTLGALLSLQAGLKFPISTVISLGGALGLDLFLRFPLELQNQVASDASSALGWFLGGRFLYPEVRLFLRWHISEPVDLLFNLRGFYPVYHLWDGSSQPFWDALMVSGGVGFAIRLRSPAATPAAPAPGSTPAAEAPAAPDPAAR
jgi:hypothetical protein